MRKVAATLLFAIVLMLTIVPVAFAQTEPEPVGSCPTGFDLHPIGDHVAHEDHHIGVHRDLNADKYICVKHLENGFHVHVDNYLPLD